MPVLLSVYQAKPLLAARAAGATGLVTSPDLNKTRKRVPLTEEGVQFETELVPWAVIQRIAEDERRVFLYQDGEFIPIQVFSEELSVLRTLCPTKSAPTTLVGGIPMHRLKEMDPWNDASLKVQAMGKVHGHVLETCFGLGYTAILLSKVASSVISYEIDPAAIKIAEWNPWSAEAFESRKIEVRNESILDAVSGLPSGHFSGVLHDPPTMAIAGELYSESFYNELRRVMKRGAPLFHYIGDPDSGVGKRVYPGVMKRLGNAGFGQIHRATTAHGVTARAV